jgi:methylated-DNA-[protein]-cysteine S-methyltransferase
MATAGAPYGDPNDVISAIELDMHFTYVDSPIGRLLLAGSGSSLSVIGLPSDGRARKPEAGWKPEPNGFAEACRQLDEYFAGRLQRFDLSLAPGGTPFQSKVWNALTDIPYGQTTTYGALAAAIGSPRAARAVGLANGQNPLPIVVPCHRVIGSDGTLTGYGGGLALKRYLLVLERRGGKLF